jgi:hypothetical protein
VYNIVAGLILLLLAVSSGMLVAAWHRLTKGWGKVQADVGPLTRALKPLRTRKQIQQICWQFSYKYNHLKGAVAAAEQGLDTEALKDMASKAMTFCLLNYVTKKEFSAIGDEVLPYEYNRYASRLAYLAAEVLKDCGSLSNEAAAQFERLWIVSEAEYAVVK